MSAAAEGFCAVTKYLLLVGANISAEDNDEMTVLMVGTESGNIELVRILLDRGAALDTDSGRWTALQLAAYMGHLAVEKLLESRGAFVPDDLFGLEALFSEPAAL